MKRTAIWRWDRGAPVPEARLVVCVPSPTRSMLWSLSDERLNDIARRRCAGQSFVIEHSFEPMPLSRAWANGLVPAHHVEQQADLARLPALFAIKAERRALVVNPQEAIDLNTALRGDLRRYNARECFERNGVWGTCVECWRGPGGDHRPEECDLFDRSDHKIGKCWIDLVIVAGLDDPVRPAHVRSIVAQCRAADVPVMFAGWGEWVSIPQAQAHSRPTLMDEMRVSPPTPGERAKFEIWFRVGSDRSGALLDGAEVCDWPEWLGGAA